MSARRPRVATGRTNRTASAATSRAVPGRAVRRASAASKQLSLSNFDTERSVSSGSALSDGFSSPSSRISFGKPETVRSFGWRSDTSSQRNLRAHGQDIKSRVQKKMEQHEKISTVFRAFDDNKNGVIDHDEFARGLGTLGFDVDKSQLRHLLKWVDPADRGEIPYSKFASAMAEHEGLGGSRGMPLRDYAGGLRDNLGPSMQVKSDAFAVEVGDVGVGEGALAGEARIQRDVGDRATLGDHRNFELEHNKGADLRTHGAVQVVRADGRGHVHTHADEGLSYFEKSLRTPRDPRMNKEFAALRVSSPGMMRAIGTDNWYGEVPPQLLGMDEYGIQTRPEPMTHRSTASFKAEARYTGGLKPANCRSRLFAQRRGDNIRENLTLNFAAPFAADVSAKRVYHFVKDKPGASRRRMGDTKFDPRTGVDLVAFEKAAIAKHTRKLTKLAERRRREALVGRGT